MNFDPFTAATDRLLGGRMSKHTPEPWVVTNSTDIFTEIGQTNATGITCDGNDGWHIADCNMGGSFVGGELTDMELSERKANARRIVACVNACAGLSTEYLEKVKISGVMAGYEDRNAELLEALELLHKNCLYQLSEEDDRVTHVDHKLFAVIEAAIAKAKGEA